VQAAVIVVPNSLTTQEGNTNSGAPFALGVHDKIRYQQVYAASAFLSLPGPHLITQLAFRPDADVGYAFTRTIPDIQINLSTTSTSPDELSVVFAENVGVDETHDRGTCVFVPPETVPPRSRRRRVRTLQRP
jgi:hypothetical protein